MVWVLATLSKELPGGGKETLKAVTEGTEGLRWGQLTKVKDLEEKERLNTQVRSR